jgi:hypothetical protein
MFDADSCRVGKPEPKATETPVGSKPVANGCADAFGFAIPAATPDGLFRGCSGALRIHPRAFAIIARIKPVLHPFPHIAAHIIDAESIRLFLSNWMWSAIGIVMVPGQNINVVTSTELLLFTTAATGVFPFSLAGETEL